LYLHLMAGVGTHLILVGTGECSGDLT
jgi:hypothetical protein